MDTDMVYMIQMLVVNEQVLETARFTNESPKIGNTIVSFNNGEWYIETPPTYLKLTTAGLARLKLSNIPIQLGEDALLYFHPEHGIILHDRMD